MSVFTRDVEHLAEEFENCRKILLALGDTNRQHILLEMMRSNQCSGLRVGEITEKTHLSRPAVSHHLRILKDAGILKYRREGTRNYYYLDADMDALHQLIRMLSHASDVMQKLPDRSVED